MIINSAGGLVYHFKALRFRNGLWLPFRRSIAQFLEEWKPQEKRLLLVGPSAGYCLPVQLLKRFETIFAVEPDRVARKIFEYRHSGNDIRWIVNNFFEQGPESLKQFLDQNKECAILFSNVIGQLSFIIADTEVWKRQLQSILNGRSWASFHDRFSGHLQPVFEQGYRALKRLTDEEIIRIFYPADLRGEIEDHCTDGFFAPQTPHSYFIWQIHPKRWHVIEAVRNEGG